MNPLLLPNSVSPSPSQRFAPIVPPVGVKYGNVKEFLMTIGEITTIVPASTAALASSLARRVSLTNTNSPIAQNKHRYSGFTRNQHATPSIKPARNANQILRRFAASNNKQFPPSTIQVVGASAEG